MANVKKKVVKVKRKYIKKSDVSKLSGSSEKSAAENTTAADTGVKRKYTKRLKGKGGRKGMHNGHQYSETCNCAICKKTTGKLLRESSSGENQNNEIVKASEVVREKIDQGFPDGVDLVEIYPQTFEVMKSKVAKLLDLHKIEELKSDDFFDSDQKFMNSLINKAVVFYVNSL